MQLWYLNTNWVNVGNPRHKKTVSGSVLCCHNRGMLAKSADIWLSGQHVADMPGTFPAKSPAPKDQKTCCLYQVNSNVSPYTCDWTNAMNHFEYLRETSDDVLTDDDKHRAYKGRGGIYMHCHPFDLHEPWEDILKRLPSSSEDYKKIKKKLVQCFVHILKKEKILHIN